MKKASIFIIWFIFPVFVWAIQLRYSGLKATLPINPNDYESAKLSVNPSFPQAVTATNASTTTGGLNYRLKSDEKFSFRINDLTRFMPTISSALIRYNLSLENNIQARIKYSDPSSTNEYGENLFPSTLNCAGETIEYGQKIQLQNRMYLGDRSNDDREYIEKVINECFYNLQIGFQNRTGKSLIVDKASLAENSSINLLIQLDSISSTFLLIAFYISWFGFLILIKEGPLNSFRKAKVY